MPYDPTTASDPFDFATDVVKAKSSKPFKRKTDSSKTVSFGGPIYVFVNYDKGAEREDKT